MAKQTFNLPTFKDWASSVSGAERAKLMGQYGSIQNAYGWHCAELAAEAQRETLAEQFPGLEVAKICRRLPLVTGE